jgi:hypothetical protein
MRSLISANFIVFLSVATLLHMKLVFAREWEHFEAILWNTLSQLQGKKWLLNLQQFQASCVMNVLWQLLYRDTVRWTSCSTCVFICLFIYLFIYYSKEYWYTNIQHSGRKYHKMNNERKWPSWNIYTDYLCLVTVISKSVIGFTWCQTRCMSWQTRNVSVQAG